MSKRFTLLFLIPVGLGVLFAQGSTTLRVVPVKSTPAHSGQEMFDNYCAACHGKQGKGDGPAAAALKKAPADLTTITARNNGKFPDLEVSQFISGQRMVDAHGSIALPVWGSIFRTFDGGAEGMYRLRIENLTNYVKSLQEK
jgi:hypothetical protein